MKERSGLKIFYIAPYCFGLENSLANAFEVNGAAVERYLYGIHHEEKSALVQVFYNYYTLVRRLKKSLDRLGLLNIFLQHSISRLNHLNKEILRIAQEFDPDIVFVVKGETLYPETLKTLGKTARLVSYHWDDPFLRYARAIDNTRDIRYANIQNSYGLYDVTFVYDDSYIEALQQAGAKRVEFLMDWYEPEIYKPLTLRPDEKKRWGSDVSFVGSPYPNRVQFLTALTEFDVGIWGPEFRWREYFHSHPFLKKQYRGEATGEEAVKVYNASKINLNIHDTFQCFSSVNNRTFQILAAGGFELVDDRERLYELFSIGKDLTTFKTPEEAVKRIRFFLTHDAERETIRKNGRERSEQHSATIRAGSILNTLADLPVHS